MKNKFEIEEYYLNQLKTKPEIFKKVPCELKDNKEFVFKAIEAIPSGHGYYFRFISENLKDDKEVVLKMIEKYPSAMEYVSLRLMKDKEVALVCLKDKYGSLDYLHYDLVDELHRNDAKLKVNAVHYLEKMILLENLQKELSVNDVKVRKPKV